MEIAKSILKEEGIEFIDLGEGVQDFFGVGRVGGLRSLVGDTGLLVAEENRGAASELLKHLRGENPPNQEKSD